MIRDFSKKKKEFYYYKKGASHITEKQLYRDTP